MFPITMQEFNMRQTELHQRAGVYRLVKSLKKSNPWSTRVFTAIGRLLIDLGHQIINRYQTQSQPV